MRATFISNLINQVAFSFEPEGLLYVSVDKIINVDGNMIFKYSRLEVGYTKLYKKDDLLETPVFLYEDTNNIFREQQPENTVFDIDISSKREVLIEKSGSYLKNEFKRLKNDSVYFYLKYCQRTHQ